jgi:hypothetical protein
MPDTSAGRVLVSCFSVGSLDAGEGLVRVLGPGGGRSLPTLSEEQVVGRIAVRSAGSPGLSHLRTSACLWVA